MITLLTKKLDKTISLLHFNNTKIVELGNPEKGLAFVTSIDITMFHFFKALYRNIDSCIPYSFRINTYLQHSCKLIITKLNQLAKHRQNHLTFIRRNFVRLHMCLYKKNIFSVHSPIQFAE